ncbi:unnamed protein product [Agarophyton chilense]|eukprot:gb/GEZJ01003375.1/.p1 GENE.gb/GEZJ01003375.1/~~gb/GEZJ01003375.1/.p1  ORF type:complete len:548 (-),score=89.59 gb/GEZJ01003375.1/:395-2008(-)
MPRASLSSRSRQQPARALQKRPHGPSPPPFAGRYAAVYAPRSAPAPPSPHAFAPSVQPSHTQLFNGKRKSSSSLIRQVARSVPMPALLCSVALAFFVFGVLVSSNVPALLDPSSPQHFGLPTRRLSTVRSVLNLSHVEHDHTVVEPHAALAPLAVSHGVVEQNDSHPSRDSDAARTQTQSQNQNPPPDCCVGMWRSWPVSPQYDYSHLHQVARHLNFSNNTLLNYFHMHKTGGVTTKYEVMVLIRRYENRVQLTSAGRPLTVIETCYQQNRTNPEDNRLESAWHCDFGQVEAFSPQKLASIDMVMGHQYWEEGCEMYFGPIRDVKHFSIFRHPLARKLSFFYHFFVRNLQRDENKVSKEEVIAFLLGDSMPEHDALTRDAGPNYYASRMISDGVTGFVGHRYVIAPQHQEQAIATVLHKLRHKYAFVGLQLQPEASQCMLQKMVQVFAHVHGMDKMYGTPKLAESKKRLNVGGYPWTPDKVWAAMTAEQRQRYREVEKVDLAIYEHVVQRFKDDLKVFACEHRVRADQWAEDQLDGL